jgi:transcriptional regulatory protein LevR
MDLTVNKHMKNLVLTFGDPTLATIAAGPLENLLNEAGNEYIEQILNLAQINNVFAKMLTGVQKSEIDQEAWDKVVKFCRTIIKPIDVVYGY